MVNEAIYRCHCYRFVGEYRIPLGKWAVAGDDEAFAFVAFGDQFE
jgi:hypothetical protein